MSEYNFEYMVQNFRVGFADTLGDPWWSMYGDVSECTYPGAIPMEDAREFLGWKPIKVELPHKKSYGNTPVMIVNERTNDLVGVMASNYAVSSYEERLLDGLSTILDDPNLAIGSMIMLDGGSKASVQITVGEIVNVGGEQFRTWIAAFTSLDGSMKTTFKRGSTRIVCDNTFAAFCREAGGKYSYKNTAGSKLDVAVARESLDIFSSTSGEVLDIFTEMESDLQAIVDEMTGKGMNESQWDKLLELQLPVADLEEGGKRTGRENKRNAISAMYFHDPRVSAYTGTQWGAFQAFSTWNQHGTTVEKGDNELQRNTRKAIGNDFDTFDAAVMRDLALV